MKLCTELSSLPKLKTEVVFYCPNNISQLTGSYPLCTIIIINNNKEKTTTYQTEFGKNGKFWAQLHYVFWSANDDKTSKMWQYTCLLL